MSTTINIEDSSDEEYDETEQNQPVEEEEEEEPPIDEQLPESDWSVCILASCLVFLLATIAVIGGVTYHVMQPDTTLWPNATTIAPTTTLEPTTKTTIRPIVPEALMCYPNQTYGSLKDENLPSAMDGAIFKFHSFHGLVTHNRMSSICRRISKLSGELYFKGDHITTTMETNIGGKLAGIFGDIRPIVPDEKKLVWTGLAYGWNEQEAKWNKLDEKLADPASLKQKYFCEDSWEIKLNNLKETQKENIYVVKDMGKTIPFCWKLFTASELVARMGQPTGSVPRLSFACTTRITKIDDPVVEDDEYSGKKAVPGFFHSRTYTPEEEYWLYPINANLDDAWKQCISDVRQLVRIDTLEKLKKVEKFLRDDSKWKPKQINLKQPYEMWTGGYLNVSDGNKRTISWIGPPELHKSTEYSVELFRDYSEAKLDDAISKSIQKRPKRIGINEDCFNQDHLYVGLKFPGGLTILNSGTENDPDKVSRFVLCERWTHPIKGPM